MTHALAHYPKMTVRPVRVDDARKLPPVARPYPQQVPELGVPAVCDGIDHGIWEKNYYR